MFFSFFLSFFLSLFLSFFFLSFFFFFFFTQEDDCVGMESMYVYITVISILANKYGDPFDTVADTRCNIDRKLTLF